MRSAIIVILAMGCGGEGKCERPPCPIPKVACSSNHDCFQSEICDFARDTCGRAVDDSGFCEPRPAVCDAEARPVCGCDGKFHGNACLAAVAGTDRDGSGTCAPPAGFFACGDTACDRQTEMCTDFDSGGGHFFTCEPIPSACANDRTCACVQRFGCGACTEAPGLTRTCMLSPDPAG